jgi:hypothetical protein
VFLTTKENNGQLFVNSDECVDVEEVSSNLLIFPWTLIAQKVLFSSDTHSLGKMASSPKGHTLVPDERCQGESLEGLVVCCRSVSTERTELRISPLVNLSSFHCISLKFQHTIGFTASPFLPWLAIPFVMEYAQLVLVDNADFIHTLQNILPLANILCRHSNIILIERSINQVPWSRQLVWTHSKLRPWGHYMPVQCSKCHRLRSWSDVYPDKNGTPQVHCLNSDCLYRIQFLSPVPKNQVQWFGTSVLGGRWMVLGM